MADNLSQAVQESLLVLLAFDPAGWRELAGVVNADHFDGFYHEIAVRVFQYGNQYGQPPGEHLADCLDDLLEGKDQTKGRLYRDLVTTLYDVRKNLNRDYVLSRVKAFVREQTLKSGILEAADRYKQGGENTVDDVEDILARTIKTRATTFSPGTFLSDPEALRFLDHSDNQAISTGIPELDRRNLGPSPKELHLFIAPPKRGKSWWLVHLGKQAFLQQKRVLHITLEMSEELCLRRYFQSLFAGAKRVDEVTRMGLELDELGRLISLVPVKTKPALVMSNEKVRAKLAKLQKKWGTRLGRLVVKEFPTKGLSVKGLTTYLDQLESISGFIPDLLIIDYADLLKIDTKDYRIALGRTYEELRGVAVSRNLALATASQANRVGAGASQVTELHTGEDFSKVATADVVLTYSCTKAERPLGLARLYVAASRNDEDKFTLLISQAYAMGQFCLESTWMRSNYDDLLKKLVGEPKGEEE